MNKRGFTLVELSIVLVIIGLLIGGILVAQSLIESAKVNKVVRDMTSYVVMIEQFQSRYKYLPGDGAKGFSPSSNGRDWKIQHGDTGKVWRDLYLAKFVDVAYDGASNFGEDSKRGISFPGIDYLKSGKAGLRVRDSPSAGALTNGPSIYGTEGNYLALIGSHQGTGALTAEQAFAFDKKIDDSHPAKGDYVTVSAWGYTSCVDGGNALSSPDVITWDLHTETSGCAVLYWLP